MNLRGGYHMLPLNRKVICFIHINYSIEIFYHRTDLLLYFLAVESVVFIYLFTVQLCDLLNNLEDKRG